MVSWLEKKKKQLSDSSELDFQLNIESLNEAQRKAFDIVMNHERNPNEQLFLMITGLAGSGKSYLINSIRALLKEKMCCVSLFRNCCF